MCETEYIKLEGGWIVTIEEEEKLYKIVEIQAIFGHGIYFPIDTKDFSQEVWDMFHERIDAVRKED